MGSSAVDAWEAGTLFHVGVSEHVDRAVALLRESREEVLAELDRLDNALKALGADTRSKPERHAAPGKGRKAPGVRPASVKARALAFLRADRGPWNAAAVIAAADRSGEPIAAKEPTAAIRTAFLELVQAGLARRTSIGFYESTEWPEEAASVLDLHPPAHHVGGAEAAEAGGHS